MSLLWPILRSNEIFLQDFKMENKSFVIKKLYLFIYFAPFFFSMHITLVYYSALTLSACPTTCQPQPPLSPLSKWREHFHPVDSLRSGWQELWLPGMGAGNYFCFKLNETINKTVHVMRVSNKRWKRKKNIRKKSHSLKRQWDLFY